MKLSLSLFATIFPPFAYIRETALSGALESCSIFVADTEPPVRLTVPSQCLAMESVPTSTTPPETVIAA